MEKELAALKLEIEILRSLASSYIIALHSELSHKGDRKDCQHPACSNWAMKEADIAAQEAAQS